MGWTKKEYLHLIRFEVFLNELQNLKHSRPASGAEMPILIPGTRITHKITNPFGCTSGSIFSKSTAGGCDGAPNENGGFEDISSVFVHRRIALRSFALRLLQYSTLPPRCRERRTSTCVQNTKVLYGAVFPIGSVRFSAVNRTALHRTVGFTISENCTEPHRRT